MLQSYLDSVLVDDRLNQSEIIYSFLSPSPDYLKTASSLPPSIARLHLKARVFKEIDQNDFKNQKYF
jgi:hypothetical protein